MRKGRITKRQAKEQRAKKMRIVSSTAPAKKQGVRICPQIITGIIHQDVTYFFVFFSPSTSQSSSFFFFCLCPTFSREKEPRNSYLGKKKMNVTRRRRKRPTDIESDETAKQLASLLKLSLVCRILLKSQGVMLDINYTHIHK